MRRTSYEFALGSLNRYIIYLGHKEVPIESRDAKWRISRYAFGMVFAAFHFARTNGLDAIAILKGRTDFSRRKFDKYCRNRIKKDKNLVPIDEEEIFSHMPAYVRDFIQSPTLYKPVEVRDLCMTFFRSVLAWKIKREDEKKNKK